jgi:hypothetical protein
MKNMKTLLLLITLSLAACSTNQLQSGEHKVVSVKKFKGKSVVKIEGSNKEFILPTDTLEKDESIYITVLPKSTVLLKHSEEYGHARN